MHATEPGASPAPERLSAMYDEALPEVYRYLRARCGSTALAEELTSATFVQAALSCSRGDVPDLSIAWLITVARHKLVDHWRRQAVAERSMTLLEGGRPDVDPWDTVLDQARAQEVLAGLSPHYRAALTLRYIDDLGVRQCADYLHKSVRGMESLLARARTAFRADYEETGGHDD